MLTLWEPARRVKNLAACAGAVLCTTVAMVPAQHRVGDAALGARSRALERLFTPLAAPPDAYEVYESDVGIDRLAAALRARDPRPSKGAWELTRTGPGDAFGAEGLYDRARLALLVGGGRITVARGSLRGANGSVTGYTLLSPYPDPALTELRTGTMTIVFHVPAGSR